MPSPSSADDFCRLQRPLVGKFPDADLLGPEARQPIEPGRSRSRNDDGPTRLRTGEVPSRDISRLLRNEMLNQADRKYHVGRRKVGDLVL